MHTKCILLKNKEQLETLYYTICPIEIKAILRYISLFLSDSNENGLIEKDDLDGIIKVKSTHNLRDINMVFTSSGTSKQKHHLTCVLPCKLHGTKKLSFSENAVARTLLSAFPILFSCLGRNYLT